MTTITYFDQTFASSKQAATYFGITRAGVNYHMRRYGNLNRVGTVDTTDHKPIVIRKIHYHSVTEAARKLGVSRATIRRARDKGYLEQVGIMPKGRGPRYSVTIRGVTYPSLTDAAKALKVTVGAISNALNRGSVETVGLGRHIQTRKQPIPITIGNITYPSHIEAAKALNISSRYLGQLKKQGKLESFVSQRSCK